MATKLRFKVDDSEHAISNRMYTEYDRLADDVAKGLCLMEVRPGHNPLEVEVKLFYGETGAPQDLHVATQMGPPYAGKGIELKYVYCVQIGTDEMDDLA